MVKKQSHFAPAQVADPRQRIASAIREGRFQHALELTKQLHKSEPTPEYRRLLHEVYMGRARQLNSEGKTRDAAVVLQAALQPPGLLPAWKAEITEELAKCGSYHAVISVVGNDINPQQLEHLQAVAVDAALAQGKAGRRQVSQDLLADFDRILLAFEQVEKGQDEAMRETLQAIGLRSPFLDWKLLLRGWSAYYQHDDARAMENWQRLDPARFPARLAAPFRFQIDDAYRQAQPPATQAVLSRQSRHLQQGEAVRRLEALRAALDKGRRFFHLQREVEQALIALRQEAPQLLPRFAAAMYWAVLKHGGPEELQFYRRHFGAPTDDPNFFRMQALGYEQGFELEAAHGFFQKLIAEIANRADVWRGEQGRRAQALLWLRMGENAAKLPSPAKLKLAPSRIRYDPRFSTQLKPTAEECLRKSMALAPDLAEPALALFHHLVVEGKAKSAIKVARDFLQPQPDHLPMLKELGSLLAREADYGEAVKIYQQALSKNPLDRDLRERLGGAHLFFARQLAEAKSYDDARGSYQAALELTPQDAAPVLCKWAACEYKAKNDTRGEELIQQARQQNGTPLFIAYSMLIEAIRMKLPALKKRVEKDFADGLQAPADPEAVVQVAECAATHRLAEINYYGQKTHQKKVSDYISKAITRKTTFTEDQSVRLVRCLLSMESFRICVRVMRSAQIRFPKCPELLFLEAQCNFVRHTGSTWHMQSLLQESLALAERLPLGPRRERLLEDIAQLRNLVQAEARFSNMFEPFFEQMEVDDDEEYF